MFRDREQAGDLLAQKLRKIIKDDNFVVVALLRGGIILGKKISDYFKILLFPLAVRKIGAPLNPELAIGAVAFDKTYYLDEDLIRHLDVDQEYIKNSLEDKRREAEVLQKKFSTSLSLRQGFGWRANNMSIKGKQVIVVDDGIATGTTAICASIYAKKQKAGKIIIATPVIAKDSLRNIKSHFDAVVSLKIADNLTSVSQFYKYFPQVTDEEVIEILNRK